MAKKVVNVQKMQEEIASLAIEFLPEEPNADWVRQPTEGLMNDLGEVYTEVADEIRSARVFFPRGEKVSTLLDAAGMRATGTIPFIVQFDDAEFEPIIGDVLIRGGQKWRVSDVQKQDMPDENHAYFYGSAQRI